MLTRDLRVSRGNVFSLVYDSFMVIMHCPMWPRLTEARFAVKVEALHDAARNEFGRYAKDEMDVVVQDGVDPPDANVCSVDTNQSRRGRDSTVNESAPAKVAPRLAERLDALAEPEQVEVIIELMGREMPVSGSRQERMAAAKLSFERDVAAVTETIMAAGGEVLESAWLNQTVRGRVSAGKVARVAADDAIAVIDLPHRLEADAHPAMNDPSP